MERSAIKALTKKASQLEADLAAERGTARPGEIIVRRYGVDSASPHTFHVRLSVDVLTALKEGPQYVEMMLDRMRREILAQVNREGSL